MIDKTFPIVEQLIDSGLQLSENLNQLLRQETDTLKQISVAAELNDITRKKQQLIDGLNLFSNHLGQILTTEQLPNNRLGIETYLARANDAGQASSQATKNWHRMAQLTHDNQSLNDQNGASIDLLLKRTQQSLNILKGTSQTSHTYGPDGSTKSDTASATIISV